MLCHLKLELIDANDKNIPLHFNTNSQGNKFSIAQLQKGYVVAILYTERHTFIHGDPGTKLIDPEMLKVRKTHLAIQFPFRCTDGGQHYKDLHSIFKQVP